ncbi:MAG: hypothetical protein J3Q66DRAFT_334625 [Benniella sp.]|nr:MAG: hypothetical protein J3Q66DRAFT_334625 [Benniella sp.]
MRGTNAALESQEQIKLWVNLNPGTAIKSLLHLLSFVAIQASKFDPSFSFPQDISPPTMKFTAVATAIAAAILCSTVGAAVAYEDKMCHQKTMRLSKSQTIQCGVYQVQNICKTEKKLIQPTAGEWLDMIRSESYPESTMDKCFKAIRQYEDPRCRAKKIQIAASENIICTNTSFKNICKTKKEISQSAASGMIKKLSGGKKTTTKGCFEAKKLY